MDERVKKPCWALLRFPTDKDGFDKNLIKENLENDDIPVKLDALKKTIYMITNGYRVQELLESIIKYVEPMEDLEIKKMLLLLWELAPKTLSNGKLIEEMRHVSDVYKKELEHPNEFIRGSTLRSVSKLNEPDLLEPLVPSIIDCLEHSNSYVRRNAVFAIFAIHRKFAYLIPEGPEVIEKYLEGEEDMSCRRNALLMLIHVDEERALSYLSTRLNVVSKFDDILQSVIVDLIRKICLDNPRHLGKYIPCIYSLLKSPSTAVCFNAAETLVAISCAPTSIKAAASSYIDIIVRETDRNAKLLVLNRLIGMKKNPSHEKCLQDLVPDILQVLPSSSIQARAKTLTFALDLVGPRTVDEMVRFLKEELLRIAGENRDFDGLYAQHIISTLRECANRFPHVAISLVTFYADFVADFLTDSETYTPQSLSSFIHRSLKNHQHLQPQIARRFAEIFVQIRSQSALSGISEILEEYLWSKDDIENLMGEIRSAFGELPLVEAEMKRQAGVKYLSEDENPKELLTPSGSDKTPTKTAPSTSNSDKREEEKRPPLVQSMMEGEYCIGHSMAKTFLKLADRYVDLEDDVSKINRMQGEAILLLASILELGRSSLPGEKMSDHFAEMISCFLRLRTYDSEIVDRILKDFDTEKREKKLAQEAEEDREIMAAYARRNLQMELLTCWTPPPPPPRPPRRRRNVSFLKCFSSRYSSQDSVNSQKHRRKWFRKMFGCFPRFRSLNCCA